MTKEEFKAKMQELDSQISELVANRKALKQAYINANAKFHVGQKISMEEIRTGKIYYGFVASIRVVYGDEIEYTYFKMKKDGTPSSVKIRQYRMTNIKAVEE